MMSTNNTMVADFEEYWLPQRDAIIVIPDSRYLPVENMRFDDASHDEKMDFPVLLRSVVEAVRGMSKILCNFVIFKGFRKGQGCLVDV